MNPLNYCTHVSSTPSSLVAESLRRRDQMESAGLAPNKAYPYEETSTPMLRKVPRTCVSFTPLGTCRHSSYCTSYHWLTLPSDSCSPRPLHQPCIHTNTPGSSLQTFFPPSFNKTSNSSHHNTRFSLTPTSQSLSPFPSTPTPLTSATMQIFVKTRKSSPYTSTRPYLMEDQLVD